MIRTLNWNVLISVLFTMVTGYISKVSRRRINVYLLKKNDKTVIKKKKKVI